MSPVYFKICTCSETGLVLKLVGVNFFAYLQPETHMPGVAIMGRVRRDVYLFLKIYKLLWYNPNFFGYSLTPEVVGREVY